MSALKEGCCGGAAKIERGAVSPHSTSAACRECGTTGSPVERRTLLHMLRPELFARIGARAYRFCASPGCDTVYFSTDGASAFGTANLRERVGLKAAGDPAAPVCYCFGFTTGDLEAEVRAGRTPEIPRRIQDLVKARLCACEVRRPSGRCCLGEIARVVKRLAASQNPDREVPTAEGDRLLTEEKRS
jgi:hypothetical protein